MRGRLYSASLRAVILTTLVICQISNLASVLGQSPFVEPSIGAGHLTIQDGLPNAFVRCVFQDSRHFMWFGDRYGLAFYNGYDFRYHKIGEVQSIHEDSNGKLWVHHARTWSHFDPETDVFEAVEPLPTESGQHERIAAIRQSSDPDKFWIFLHQPEDQEQLASCALFDVATRSIDRTIELSDSAFNSRCVSVDAQSIWCCSSGEESVHRLDLASNKKQTYEFDSKETDTDPSVESIYVDRTTRVWVLTTDGVLHCINNEEQTAFPFVETRGRSGLIGAGATPSMCLDEAGRLWIATDGHGLFRFSPDTERFVAFQHDQSDTFALSSDRISGIYQDRNGIFWLNTQGSGIDFINPSAPTLQHLAHDPDSEHSLGHPAVWTVFQDREGICWFGHDTGLDRFDPSNCTFKHFQQLADDPNTISTGRNISVVYEDSKQRLWVGSWNGGLNLLDRETGIFKHYNHDEDDELTLQSDRVSAIMEDHEQTLWIGTSRGLCRYEDDQDRFVRVPINPTATTELPDRIYLRTIAELPDEPGILWLGGWEDLGLVRFDVKSNECTRFAHDPANAATLSHNIVRVVHPAKDGAVWVGTSDGLNKFDRQTGHFTRFTTADGMPSNSVCGIAEDNDSTLWISTSRGLCHFRPAAGTFKKLGVPDGIRIPEFIQRSYFQAEDGTLFFGGTNGISTFHPNQVKPIRYSSPLRITDFRLFNNRTSLENTSLQKHAWATDEIVLARDQNIFSFEFSALDYLQRDSIRYRYRLHGFQDDWTETGSKNRVATYTDLRPGQYTFQVNSSDPDGNWLTETSSVELQIRPAWWETLPFRFLLLSTVLFAGAGIYRNRIRTYQHRAKKFADLYDALKQEGKERETAVKNFKAVSDKFTRLFQNAREAIYFSTPSGQILDINPAGVELLGYESKREVVSSNTIELLGIDAATQADFFRRIRESGFVRDFELPLRRKDGHQLFVVVSASAVHDDNGQIEEIHGIIYDLTRKKELESQLFQSQKMEAIGTLAAGVAHDFNNLLTVIMTNAEIIKHSPPTGDSTVESGAILLACSNASRLTDQLLTYSQQDASFRKAAPISVVEIARDVSALISSTLPKRISLRSDFDPKAGYVTADPAQLQQIAMNLCTNAIQAIGDGPGEVSIRVTRKVLKGETTTGNFQRLDGPHVELRVKDSGAGIPPDKIGRLFDPFYTTRKKGTGLGLSVLHGIVKELGGQVDVSSQLGHGSEFVVLLPQSKVSAPHLDKDQVHDAHILLADDEPAVRTAFEKILRAKGYRTSGARDGVEAMELLNSDPSSFDIIVTDERMPRMTGTEFASAARQVRPDIPVLLVSGHVDNEGRGTDSNLLQGFIRKPIKATELHEQIQAILRSSAVKRATKESYVTKKSE